MPQDEGLHLSRLLEQARRQARGSIPEMVKWLEQRKRFLADESLINRFDRAIDILSLDSEVDLTPPKMVPGPQLKRGMVLEEKEFTVTLGRDAYTDPEDQKLTIEGVRSDTGKVWRAEIDATAKYWVAQLPEVGRVPTFGLSMGL